VEDNREIFIVLAAALSAGVIYVAGQKK